MTREEVFAPVYDPKKIEYTDLINYARSLIRLYDAAPLNMRSSLHRPLVHVHNMLRAVVIYPWIGPNAGRPIDMYSASFVVLTGSKPGTGAHRPRCKGFTQGGERCRNNSWVGLDHCHWHATEDEHVKHAVDEAVWENAYNQAIKEKVLTRMFEDLEKRYKT